MFSQKEATSPLAEKRLIYSSIRRGIFGRRCYSESTFVKKRKDEPQPPAPQKAPLSCVKSN
jgi:hypothetical protein